MGTTRCEGVTDPPNVKARTGKFVEEFVGRAIRDGEHHVVGLAGDHCPADVMQDAKRA